MFQIADLDKDGKISYTEFQAMMINPPKPQADLHAQPSTAVKRVTINTTAMVDSTDTIESNIDDKDDENELLIANIIET